MKNAAAEARVQLDIRTLEVTDEDEVSAFVKGVETDHGRVDVLVNNAGRGSLGTAEQLSMSAIRERLEVNYIGPVGLAKAHAWPEGMRTDRQPDVVGDPSGQPAGFTRCRHVSMTVRRRSGFV